jgi:hypothetical protein
MPFFDGTITTTASEQNLFDITSDAHFATWVFLHNMTASETFVVKVYVKDQNGAAMRLTENEPITGVQDPPSLYFAFVPTKQYKVSIQRTAGTDRAVTWQRIEIPIA